MKKNYFLIAGLMLASVASFAQQSRIEANEVPMKPAPVSAEELKYNEISNVSKAEGDTLFYEDFGGGFSTNGWTSVDPSQNGFDWIYTTAAPGGQYSSTIPVIASATAANGFLSMPSDFYNTPTPAGGFAGMSAVVTSGPIAINPVGNVIIKWKQAQRYCCASTEQLELQVSTDNVTFVAFDAKFGRQANTNVTEDAEINISSVAANEDTIYLRFFQSSSHYFWMIDDIAIVEGPGNQLVVNKGFSTFGSDLFEGYYSITPLALTQALSFQAAVQNDGGFNAPNTGITLSIDEATLGNVYLDSSAKIASLPTPLGIDTFEVVTPFANTSGNGDYTATITATSDSGSADPGRATYAFPWSISDTVLAKDFDNNGGNIGPGSYVGGDNDGSKMATKFTLKSAQTVTSVSYFISTSTANVGAEMKAQVWGFDTSQATLNDAINVAGIKAQNPIPYIVQSTDVGTWLTIPMLPPAVLPAGQYVVVAEQSAGNANGFELGFGRARDAEEFQPFGLQFVSMVYANDASPSWGNIFAQPMMRMNFGLLAPVGVDESAKAIEGFTVSPNPNNGQFNVTVNAAKANFNLSVRNMVGQVVYNEAIAVNNILTKNIDLSNLNKGIYFVSIENGVNRKVQKVIIK